VAERLMTMERYNEICGLADREADERRYLKPSPR
jgi:hypothetical protein